jgi:rhodanese-related sulfurtransferase
LEPIIEITPKELERRLAEENPPILADVRTAPEVAAYHIEGIRWIPLDEFGARFAELNREREIVVICEHGIRSEMARQFLARQGYERVYNLAGGMSCWTGETMRGLPKAP